MAETNTPDLPENRPAGRLLGPVVSPPGPHAAYAARPQTSRGRFYPETESATRSCYSRDRDRIIHSSAFRRLKHKTQVFVQHEGDYYRTRLTHSLEVAQLARSLARTLSADEDLAETVALAHDLGHTPFGHAGEEAHLDDPGLAFVQLGELSEQGVEREDVERFGFRAEFGAVEGHTLPAAAAHGGGAAARVIDEQTPDGLRCEREEVLPVPNARAALVGEFQPSLMDEIRRLPGVRAAFPSHRARGKPAQLLVEHRHEPVSSRAVPSPVLGQEPGDLGGFLNGDSCGCAAGAGGCGEPGG